jgi:hypothetical protein
MMSLTIQSRSNPKHKALLQLPEEAAEIDRIFSWLECADLWECDILNCECDDITTPLTMPLIIDVKRLNAIAARLESLDYDDIDKVDAYLEINGAAPADIENALDQLDRMDFYNGYHVRELAEELVADGVFGDAGKELFPFIDFDKLADAMKKNGFKETARGVLYCA